MRRSARFTNLGALLALLMIAMPALAGPFTPPESDQSVKMVISKLFGGAMGGGDDLMGPLLGTFNAAVLTIGGLIAAYVMVVGTIQTAHDGEMLGKRWSSIWVPIRTALGVALAVPIKGYCLAQIIVVWLALQGVGLADKVWTSFATGTVASGDLVMNPHNPRVSGLAEQILASLVCVEAINKTIADAPEVMAMGAKPAAVSTSNVTESANVIANAMGASVGSQITTKTVVNFGGGAVDTAACGQIVMKNKVAGGAGLDVTFRGTQGTGSAAVGGAAIGAAAGGLPGAAVGGAVGAAASLFDIKWVGLQRSIVPPGAVEMSHRQATAKLITELSPLARAIATAGDDNYAAADSQKQAIDKAMASYESTVRSAAMSGAAEADMGAMTEAIAADGWMLAGAWYLRIVKMQNEMNAAVGAVPAARAGQPLDGMFSQPVDQAQRRLKSFVQATLGSDRMAITAYNSAYNRTPSAPNANGAEDFNRLLTAFTSVDLRGLASDPRNPLIVAKEMGDSMLEWAENGILAMVAGSLLGPFATMVAPILALIVFSGISAGVFLALYLPFVPFLIWMGAFIGWIILLTEAVIAAPLWAVAKIVPEGDGIMGAAKPAYMLLLSLTLRPVLMVFGIICSMLMLQPLGSFINQVVIDALTVSNTGGGVHWMLVAVGGVMIYAVLLIALVNRLFALIHGIPDHVLRWISVSDSKLAGFTGETEQQGSRISGGIGAVIQSGGNSVGNAAGGLGDGLKRNHGPQAGGNMGGGQPWEMGPDGKGGSAQPGGKDKPTPYERGQKFGRYVAGAVDGAKSGGSGTGGRPEKPKK